jgi:hypothetical protein
MFVNAVDVETCIFIWDKISTEKSIAIVRATTALIFANSDKIRDDAHPFTIVKSLAASRLVKEISEAY